MGGEPEEAKGAQMTRYPRILGLVLTAALGVSVVAASAAPAQQGELTSDGPVTLLGTETAGIPANGWTVFFGKVECPGSTFTGHKHFITPHSLVASGSTEVTFTPHYNQAACVSESGGSSFSTTIDMNGCDFVLRFGHTSGLIANGTYGATIAMECQANQQIQLTQFSSDSHAFKICTTNIRPQFGTNEIHVTNSFSGDLVVRGALRKMHAEKSGLCGANTTNEAELDVSITLEGRDSKGKATSISLTH